MKEPAITISRLRTIVRQIRIWLRWRLAPFAATDCMLSSAQAGQPTRLSVRPSKRSQQHEHEGYLLSRWKLPRFMLSHSATSEEFSALPMSPTPWRKQNKTLRKAKWVALSMHFAFSPSSSHSAIQGQDSLDRKSVV